MSNMIEKVARAINPLLWEAYDIAPANEHGLDESIALSLTMGRRAIEAMMEPAEDMIDAGRSVIGEDRGRISECHKAMLQEALKDD